MGHTPYTYIVICAIIGAMVGVVSKHFHLDITFASIVAGCISGSVVGLGLK